MLVGPRRWKDARSTIQFLVRITPQAHGTALTNLLNNHWCGSPKFTTKFKIVSCMYLKSISSNVMLTTCFCYLRPSSKFITCGLPHISAASQVSLSHACNAYPFGVAHWKQERWPPSAAGQQPDKYARPTIEECTKERHTYSTVTMLLPLQNFN